MSKMPTLASNRSKTDSNPQSGDTSDSVVSPNDWSVLRQFTDARIALGSTGISLPTHQMLAFQRDHALARDAVHTPLDAASLAENLKSLSPTGEVTCLHSRASTREEYLKRPDFGRRLSDESLKKLKPLKGEFDLALTVVDGLSSLAVATQAEPFLHALRALLDEDAQSWNLAPLTICEQGRVAVGDEIAEKLGARMVLVLIGERPGLSSPDSMGLYLTHAPKVGLTDESRNCISNVRGAGLPPKIAAKKAFALMQEARRLSLSGVDLKDRSSGETDALTSTQTFLTKP
jgi:ethanolamine ammonia-lyase small subunit